MGTVFRKTFTKPLPAGAELFTRKGERFARWKDAKGHTRTEAVTTGDDGADRLLIVAGTYTAKYRDGSGIVREVATGCRDKTAAESVLGDLERRAELVRSNLLTADEANVIDHQTTAIAHHVTAYIEHLHAKGTTAEHRSNVNRILKRLIDDCCYCRLGDLSRGTIERWLLTHAEAKMGARTRNTYLSAAVAFANWCVESRRLVTNPFAQVTRADEKADPKRKRRAMTEDELVKLLAIASRRPLLDAMMIRRGKRKGQTIAKLSDTTRTRLEMLGRERALIYKTLVLTGLRKGELASLTVGQLELDGQVAYAVLNAADEKNREGSDIPIRVDLANDLRSWLDDKLAVVRTGAHRKGQPVPDRLPLDEPIFDVPQKLVKILNRDLIAAGIAKRDERGRTIDVHALRHSFGTLLSKGGVAPRTAQAAMRHGKIDLTMNVYTDPKLLDVSGALESLPALSLNYVQPDTGEMEGASGTENSRLVPLAPTLAPNHGNPGDSESFPVKTTGANADRDTRIPNGASRYADKRKHPLSAGVKRRHQMGDTGLEPVTPSLSSWCSSQLS